MEAFNGGAEKAKADPDANEPLVQEILLDLEISLFHSNSYRRLASLSRDVVVPLCKANDRSLHHALAQAGFKTDWGEDESGLLMKFLRRGGGYYMSVGCSELIAAGAVAVIGLGDGEEPRLCEGGVVVGGETVEADLVVFATGYTNMSEWVGLFCGADVEAKVGHVGGYGSGTRDDPGPYIGELRNQWGGTAQEGLWIFCGNFTQCRFYSRVTAVLIQIALLGGWDAARGVVVEEGEE